MRDHCEKLAAKLDASAADDDALAELHAKEAAGAK